MFYNTRLFRPPPFKIEESITLTPDEIHHLFHVTKCRVGDCLDIIVANTAVYTCKITQINKKALVIEKIKKNTLPPTEMPHITLIQCMPKQDKFSTILRMGTEIGIDAFVPVYSERSIPKLIKQKEAHKQQRWQQVCLSASMQSQRTKIPTVAPPILFSEFMVTLPSDFDLIVVPWEDEKKQSLNTCLTDYYQCHSKASNNKKHRIAIIVGPEGGLTENEVQSITHKGGYSVSLGSTILRTEHAGFYVITQLHYHLMLSSNTI